MKVLDGQGEEHMEEGEQEERKEQGLWTSRQTRWLSPPGMSSSSPIACCTACRQSRNAAEIARLKQTKAIKGNHGVLCSRHVTVMNCSAIRTPTPSLPPSSAR